jgi:hypothetical protein
MKGLARFLPILAVGTALPSLGQVTSSSPGDRCVIEDYDLTAENSRPDRILEWL